jgi:hypothetical protein
MKEGPPAHFRVLPEGGAAAFAYLVLNQWVGKDRARWTERVPSQEGIAIFEVLSGAMLADDIARDDRLGGVVVELHGEGEH